MCAVVFAALLWAVRRLDFYYDEWDFVDKAERWRFEDYFVPHNEHWSTVPMVVYRLLIGLFGMHSYLPYSAALLLLHCGNAFLLFVVIRRRCGDALGIGAAAIMLVLGRGSDDFIWAFQIGFSCSVLFGLVALVLLDAERPSRRALVGASVALVLSLASSGEGLFFVVAAGVSMVLRCGGLGLGRALRRGGGMEATAVPSAVPEPLVPRLWSRYRKVAAVLAAPIVAYGVWYPLYGAQHATEARSPLTLHAASGLFTFVPTGLGSGMTGIIGLDWQYRWIGFATFVALFALLCRRGRTSALAVGLGVGVVAQFCLTGLVRAQYGDQLAGTSRYVYIAAVFILPMLAETLRTMESRLRWQAALATVAAVGCFHSTFVLDDAISDRNRLFSRQKAMLQTAWFLRDDPQLNLDAIIDPADAPTLTVRLYLQTRRELGSPLRDLDARGIAALDAGDVGQARRNVLGGSR
ncbi:hypothetical protein [Catenulispora subtropica]